MSGVEVGRTRFRDGMRVATVHLEHLQDVLLGGVGGVREAAGLGKVAHGFQVGGGGGASVTVGPGLAFDRLGRQIRLDEARDVPLEGTGPLFLVARHALRSETPIDGTPTVLSDDVAIEARTAAPPYDDDAVVFARVDQADAAAPKVVQLGAWYLPPLDHGHSGAFVLRQGRWRFDGAPVGPPALAFDSGFVPVDPNAQVDLVHGLKTLDLVVQVQSRLADGTVTTKGLGSAFWYELPDDQHVRLRRGSARGALSLRATIWPIGAADRDPTAPIADAGDGLEVPPAVSFTLDGSRSRAFGGRRIERYIWMELS